MKRFTETGKWSDAWFRKLPPKIKLLWQYVCDTCDAAGVFELDTDLATLQIGEKIEESDLEMLATRLQKLPSGKMLILNFIPFQYGELSVECRPHKVVFDAIRKHKLEYPINTLPIGVQYPSRLDKDKEQEGKEGAGRKTKDNLPTTPKSKKIADLFHRRHSTPWSDKEISAFRKVMNLPDEDFELVCEFYEKSGSEYLRKELQTFLNNFLGEVDKARAWKNKRNGNGVSHIPSMAEYLNE